MTNGSGQTIYRNGNAALTKLVWWAIGIGGTIVLGAAAFFASATINGMRADIEANSIGRELRAERISVMESRLATLENTGSASMTLITRSLDKMETWQGQVQQDIADIKAAMKLKP